MGPGDLGLVRLNSIVMLEFIYLGIVVETRHKETSLKGSERLSSHSVGN